MFGFLKNKLKEWVDTAKDKLSSEEVKEPEEKEIIDVSKKPEKKKKEKLEKKKKSDKKEKKSKEIKETVIEKEVGSAIAIETELEEGVSEEILKEDIKELTETKEEKEEEKKPGFIKRLFSKKENVEEEPTEEIEIKEATEEPEEKKSLFNKVKSSFIYKITDEDFNSLFDDLEMLLLENNVALEVTEDIKKILSQKLIGKEISKKDLEEIIKKELKSTLNEILIDPDDPITAIKLKKQEKDDPFVILFFGINGTGKTTSIAKLTHLLKSKGISVVLTAADTFRAASIEQISEHAKRLDVPLIKHDYGADPAAVGFDGIKYARNHKIDVVLIDTAGRMHTKTNLLNEMEKICRVTNPDLKIFVAESIAGNDATEQAKAFNEMIGVDGSILSKADIDEKGGTIISISHITKKPIFYLGTGQKYEDLKLFNKEEFINNLGL